MKHQKYITTILAISVLATSCLRDKIDDLQNQINALKGGQISTISEQITNIQSSILNLERCDTEVINRIEVIEGSSSDSDKSDIEKLQRMDESLQGQINSLKEYVDLLNNDTHSWASATFATLEKQNEIYSTLSELSATVSTLSSKYESIKTDLEGLIESSEESLKSWVSEQLSAYNTIAETDQKLLAQKNALESYLKSEIERLENRIENTDSQKKIDSLCNVVTTLKETLEKNGEDTEKLSFKIDQMKTDITEAYTSAIEAAINGSEGRITTAIESKIKEANDAIQQQISSINEALDELKSKVTALIGDVDGLKKDVADILNMIQSVIVVPDYTDGSVKLPFRDTTIISFEVYPLEAAQKLADNWEGLVSVRALYAETKASHSFAEMEVLNVEYEDGIVNVKISTKDLRINAFTGEYDVNLRMLISDGTSAVATPYFPATTSGLNYIYYTTTDGNPVTLNPSYSYLYSNVYSNKYQNGEGIIIANPDIKTLSQAFINCTNLLTVDFSHFDSSKVNNMRGMFFGCTSLEKANISSLNTSKVTTMRLMFSQCSNLEYVDISNFNTENVTDFGEMFSGCTSIKQLNFKSFNTSKTTGTAPVINNVKHTITTQADGFAYMFKNCSSLESLDLSTFDTSNCLNMSNMFSGCTMLKTVDISSFDTSNVTTMENMFSECSSLSSLDISSFNTSNVEIFAYMFNECSTLAVLDISKFDTSNAYTLNSMFLGCSNLTKLDVSAFKADNVIDAGYMFKNCSKITSLNLSSLEMPNNLSIAGMFIGCSSLKTLDISHFNTAKVEWMNDVFVNCSSLTNLDLSNFDTHAATSMQQMFYGCSSLKTLNISSFDTSKVKTMYLMFGYCSVLSTIDLSSFKTENVTNMGLMFYYCKALTSLDLSNFDCNKVTSFDKALYYCSSLNSIKVPASMAHLDPVSVLGIKRSGKLYYPTGSDFSKWMSNSAYYLGYYGWTAVEY